MEDLYPSSSSSSEEEEEEEEEASHIEIRIIQYIQVVRI